MGSRARSRKCPRALSVLGVAVVAVAAISVAFTASTGAAAERKPLIVWLEQGAGNPYWDAEHKAAAEAARRLGFRFKAVSGNSNPADQAAILRQLVDDRVDLVMVNAIDPRNIGPSLLYARAKRVRTLFLNGLDAKATASITFDELRSGRMAAMHALRLLQRYGRASGRIAVLEGIRGQQASDLRARGFIDVMQRAGATVVSAQPTNWQADTASAAMQTLLAKYPDLSMVYAVSDTIAVPAMNVAARQKRLCTPGNPWSVNASCVAFVSVDGSLLDEVVRSRLFSTELYSASWTGYNYAKFAAGVVAGGKERRNVLNSLLVTPDNAACVSRMASHMEKTLTTFDFAPTLHQIAAKYGCKVLDGST
jgi:ribose transport system substrate-binding protein